MRVNMFGLRLRIDCTQRSKNGQPAHSTTGVVRTSSTQVCTSIDKGRICTSSSTTRGRYWPNMASTSVTTVRGSVQQNRREKSRRDRKSDVKGRRGSVRENRGG